MPMEMDMGSTISEYDGTNDGFVYDCTNGTNIRMGRYLGFNRIGKQNRLGIDIHGMVKRWDLRRFNIRILYEQCIEGYVLYCARSKTKQVSVKVRRTQPHNSGWELLELVEPRYKLPLRHNVPQPLFQP